MNITETHCCAFSSLSAGNDTTVEELKETLNWQRQQSKKNWTPTRRGGAPTLFCMTVMPYEEPLAKNLQKVGFEFQMKMPRRKGYPEGEIHMYTITL